MIKVVVKGGSVSLTLPPNVEDGEYDLSVKENNADVMRYYYAVPVGALLQYANQIGKKIDGKDITKENADAYIVNNLMHTFADRDYSFAQDVLFRPILTKRNLNREKLIEFVNLACHFVGGKIGKMLPLYEDK